MTTTIQTEEQLGKLRAEGYSEVQGFLLGKPMPRKDAEALIFGEKRQVKRVSSL
ncbi:EAL domain-containing protein (putative c-di-GMP-specific phosphodiesterase class I) [Rhizobium sp. BK313]|uniref:hypothetical protein n=1 Tax=Rhizobium sp. BK313 TaxID=2587081 RepID=UPI001414DD50|nr:hypothetical protein [Rhizobium sp. BK313]MBB3458911.1 EAL domain-containing protein (putative c-di-GMP-specific phosphodiesterase class I) [Rhizobium sp. BK313]